jgi:fibronectin type 3 domain-containing protein
VKFRIGEGCGLVGSRAIGQAIGASGPAVPSPLTNLTAEFGDPDVSVEWSASSGATSYRVERSAAGAGSWSTLEAAEAGTSYLDEAPGDGLFDYRVTPVNAAGDGTAAIAEDVATASPGAVQGLALTFDADSGNLSWTAAQYAATYKVERRDSDVGSGAGAYSTLAAAHTTIRPAS